MKQVIQNEKYGTIEFTEGNLIGNRTISINGELLSKKSNKKFQMNDGTIVEVKGGVFTGIKLQINNDEIKLSNSLTWYEIAILIAGFVFLMVWSNSVALCSIIPMIGGAIGGALYALSAVLGFSFSSKQKSPLIKIAISLCSVVVGLAICTLLGVLLVMAIA
ncbi:MAG: hypothetical protein J6D23_02995 [Clostridia bacterium]|nr:hypothetical protein [Clostridia bacterium]